MNPPSKTCSWIWWVAAWRKWSRKNQMSKNSRPLSALSVEKASGWRLFIQTVIARAYPRLIGQQREKSWVFFDVFLPMLAVSAYVFVYRAIGAPEEYVGFVVMGGAMT